MKASKALSLPERPLCVMERLGRKKKRAHGERWPMGRGKREERLSPFPSSHRSPRAFYFFDYCYFYRDTQREPLRRRESNKLKDKKNCNCRKTDTCPMDGNCNVESIIYQAEVTSQQLRKPTSGFATLHSSQGIGITQAHFAMNGIETQMNLADMCGA